MRSTKTEQIVPTHTLDVRGNGGDGSGEHSVADHNGLKALVQRLRTIGLRTDGDSVEIIRSHRDGRNGC